MEIKSLGELLERGCSLKEKRVMAVPAAEGEHVIGCAYEAKKRGLADSILIGDEAEIRRIMGELQIPADTFRIEKTSGHEESAIRAVQLINEGAANFILKGMLSTTDILRQVVKKENNLRTGRTMSHFAMYEMPEYHKLLCVTDGGMVNPQDLQKKTDITYNACETLRKLGYEMPKVALLCCKEEVDPHMPETMEAREIRDMAREGKLGSCFVEGPISYDIAMSKRVAETKKFDCPYSGDFDILVAPQIHAGNILGKCLSISCHAKVTAIIVGAKVPIVASSRASTTEAKLTSIAIAALVAVADDQKGDC
ncbi:MAG: phosphate butyryltransferase [Parasporobacterium sp.]|nr:phosphate butyryltransferase [Parasporobacterium sp.]